MNQQSGHLSDLQIQECAVTVPGDGPEEVEAHLSECESCLSRLLEWQRTQMGIGEVDAMRPEPYADCPEEGVLQEVAAEMASPETSTRILEHASQCDHCGPLLKQYLEDFSEELSPEIEALIDQLPFSQPQWQRQKAHEIARKLRPEPVPWWKGLTDLWSRKWVPAMVGTTVVLAGIGIVIEPPIMNLVQIRGIDKQIQRQKFEARFTNMPPTSFHNSVTIMGSENQDWSPALSEATQLCVQGNARACQSKGRLLLHDPKNAKAAADAFNRAQDLGLNTASLKIDLGVADLLQAKYSDEGAAKFKSAIKKLKEVCDDKTPGEEDRKAACFNLALAYELSGDSDALSRWNKYLDLDSSGGWADEARIHLNKLSPKPQ